MTKHRAADGEAKRYFFDNYLLPIAHDPGWPFATQPNGYGVLTLSRPTKHWRIHALSCTLAHGPRPTPAHQAAHACRNKACFWAEHLSWKTPPDHELDKIRDGTKPFGDTHHNSKITSDVVREIRRRYAAGGVFQRELAAEFGITQSNVAYIISRKSWPSVE